MSNFWSDLVELQKFWQESYPRRAQGGQVAIRGFDYQIKLFLLRVVEQWVKQSPIERSEYKTSFVPLMESLSDILDVQKDIIVASQVKYTLRSGSLGEALDEFSLIYNLTKTRFPHLLPVLRFKIISSRSELQDIKKSADGWIQRNNNIVDSDFSALITICTDTYPEYRLLALLANELQCSEPLIVLHRWIGVIVDASVTGNTLEHAGKNIWNDLHKMWRDLRPPNGLYIWQSNDIPPTEVLPGGVLTGQRPSIRHLRDGFFQRRNIYDDLEKIFFKWIDELVTDQDYLDKIPIFWIGGRSGSGKSVALLHLLSILSERGISPVIWLGHHTSLLAPALHFALNNQSEPFSIIGLDDPYVVEDGVSPHWDDFFASAHSIMQNEVSRRLPILVACGPTEQADLFRSDYGEHLNFFRHDMPHDTTKEHAILQEWYSHRTGSPPLKVDNSNTLLVQLFFQWDKHETIAEFSTRLKERLSLDDEDKAILHKVSRILALNRLYIGYSLDAVRHDLTPRQEDQLDWLEGDLHLGEREIGGKSGYWLLHAHLANSVFLNWYGNRPSSYKEYFKQATLDCFVHGKKPIEQTAPMWVLSQVLSNNNIELRSRMDVETARKLAKDIYIEINTKINPLPLSILPVWIEISLSTPELKLNPDPIESAIAMIHPDMIEATGLRLTCHKLLQHYDKLTSEKQDLLTRTIFRLLSEAPDWSGWSHILEHVIKQTRDPRFITLLKQRLLYPTDYRVANILRLAVNIWPWNEEVHTLITKALSHAPCNFFWCDLAKQFIQSIQKIPEEVYQWIYSFRRSREICFILSEGLTIDYKRFEEIALKWVQDWNREPSANYVLEPLLQKRPKDTKVRGYSINWIKVGTGDKSFILEQLLEAEPTQELFEYISHWLETEGKHRKTSGYLMEKLLDAKIYSDQTLEFSLKWLSENINNSSIWPILWISCSRRYTDNEVLFTLGVKWIESNELNHQFMGYVLQCLNRMQPQQNILSSYLQKWHESLDISSPHWIYNWIRMIVSIDNNPELLNKGIQWLEVNNLSHPLWTRVCTILCDKAISHPVVFQIAERFLKENDTESAWPKIWQSMHKKYPYTDWLLETALKWLRWNFNNNSWNYIWRAIFEDHPRNDIIVGLGISWLQKNELNQSWSYIWLELFARDSNHSLLVPLAIRYLERFEDTEGWSYVWQKLNQIMEDDEYLFSLGARWLNLANLTSPGWTFIWQPLFTKQFPDPTLFTVGKRWLEENSPSHLVWGHIWIALMNKSSEQPLIDLGFNCLKSTDSGDNWHIVWIRLVKIFGMTDELFEIGLEWTRKEDCVTNNWDAVWNQLFKSERNRDEILRLGLYWLQQMDIHHNSFVQIWGFLFSQLPQEATLKSKALLFLSYYRHSKPGSWHTVWRRMLKANIDKEQMVHLGFEFLSKVDTDHGSWPSVWQDLYHENLHNSWLNKKGRKWLLQYDSRLNTWIQLWLKIYPNSPKDWELRKKGTHWLQNNNNASKAEWPHVWLEVHKHYRADWTLQLGLDWLAQYKKNGWIEVWKMVLATHGKQNQKRLVQLGNNWICKFDRDEMNVTEIKKLLSSF
ncbi:hypothetical protein ABES58_28265 [Paenibacillus lautus]|uniref:hypothetical protein n=1 Tax=Paenibacillus lautus TaxID=1401 RepID=UPI003D294FB2